MDANLNSSIKVAKDVKIQLDHFKDIIYTWWVDKLVFLLTSWKIYCVLDLNLSALLEPQEDKYVAVKTERLKCEEDEMLCRRHILNTLTSQLYDIFSKLKSPKEILVALETLQAGKIRFWLFSCFNFFFSMGWLITSESWIKSMKFKCWYQNLVIWISKFLIHFKWGLFYQNLLHPRMNIGRRCCIQLTIIPLNYFKHTYKLRFYLVCVNCKQ